MSPIVRGSGWRWQLRHAGSSPQRGGVAIGGAAAYAGRSMQALLAGVKPDDPATFAGAIAVAGFMLVVGTMLPTLRALGVDPIQTIRAE